jgi:hypothetical protein
LSKIRHFNDKKYDFENAIGPIIEGKNGEAKPGSAEVSKSPKSDDVGVLSEGPGFVSRRTAKVT